jgi:hypothetical protein
LGNELLTGLIGLASDVHFPIAQRLILLAMPDRMRRFFSAILLPAVPSCRVARAQEGDLSSRGPCAKMNRLGDPACRNGRAA